MLSLMVVAALAQAPGPVTLLEGSWLAAEFDEKQVVLWSDVLFSELSSRGVVVRRKSDVAEALGLERQKQLLGCTADSANCSAEIAQALNADGIISGSVGKSGSSLVINVRVVSTSGIALAQKSAVVPSMDAALAEMKPLANAILDQMAKAFPSRITQAATVRPGAKRFWWIPASVGVVALGVGVGLQISARGIASNVSAGLGYDTLVAAQAGIDSGKAQETASFIAFGLAGAAAVATGLLVWLGQDTVVDAPVALAPTLNGFVLVGRWP